MDEKVTIVGAGPAGLAAATTATALGLRTAVYRPQVHYQQVRDSWAGVRNPDGR